MNALLALSRGIDRCNLAIGRFSSWLILLVVLISAGNAVMRKLFDSSSNAWLGNAAAQGHCGAALKDNNRAAVLLVPNAPHTLLNLPATRSATAGFLLLLATKP